MPTTRAPTRKPAEQCELLAYLRSPEGFAEFGNYGDRAGWSTERTAVEAMKELASIRKNLNTPELHDFSLGTVKEAVHQRQRWGTKHDAGKTAQDWFWLVGYLAGKILHSLATGDVNKAKHHCISTAATLSNWHAALCGHNNDMRPGHGEEFTQAVDQPSPRIYNGLLCKECDSDQFSTIHGVSCENGHGGVEGYRPRQRKSVSR